MQEEDKDAAMAGQGGDVVAEAVMNWRGVGNGSMIGREQSNSGRRREGGNSV